MDDTVLILNLTTPPSLIWNKFWKSEENCLFSYRSKNDLDKRARLEKRKSNQILRPDVHYYY